MVNFFHLINRDNIHYSVNEKEKKVVCWIENTENLFIDFFSQHSKITFRNFYYEKFFEALKMPNKFIGVATCGPDDIWDEKLGRLIAYDRAKKKVSSSFFKRANYCVDKMESFLDEICADINNYGAKLQKNQDHREDLINSFLGE